MSQPVMKITTNPESCITRLLEKLQKRLLSLLAIYFQVSAMAATGEWRDKLCCLKLACESLDRAVG